MRWQKEKQQEPRGVYLKSQQELAIMRRGGHMLQRIIHEVCDAAQEGVTTLELDKLAYHRIREAKAKPAFLGQYGFPNTLCISVNEAVVHGVPTKRKLQSGDIVSIDCGLILEGFYADTAYTVGVGQVSELAQRLMKVTKESLYAGIAAARNGNRVGDVGAAVEDMVRAAGFWCIEKYAGHGVGRTLHEDPQILNQGPAGKGKRLVPGMTVAIEPMVAVGTSKTRELSDKWTVVTADGSLAAHYEHTVAILEDGVEILTLDPSLDREYLDKLSVEEGKNSA